MTTDASSRWQLSTMTEDLESHGITLARQQEIFAELVSCQDTGMTAQESRSKMAETFSISIQAVEAIESLGLTKSWPPLD